MYACEKHTTTQGAGADVHGCGGGHVKGDGRRSERVEDDHTSGDFGGKLKCGFVLGRRRDRREGF